MWGGVRVEGRQVSADCTGRAVPCRGTGGVKAGPRRVPHWRERCSWKGSLSKDRRLYYEPYDSSIALRSLVKLLNS